MTEFETPDGSTPLRGGAIDRLASAIGGGERVRVVVGAILAIAGLVLLVVSASRDRLWWLLLWFLFGIVLLAISMLWFNDELVERREAAGGADAVWWIGFGAIAGVGLAALAVAVVGERHLAIAAIGTGLLVVGITGLFVALGGRSGPPPGADDAWYRALGSYSATGIGLMLVAIIGVAGRDGFDGISWLMVLVWIVGLVLLKIGIVPFLESRRGAMRPAFGTLIVITLVGGVLIYAGSTGARLIVLLIGISLVIAALSVLGLATLFVDIATRPAVLLCAGGLVAGVLLWWWTTTVVNGWQLGAFVALLTWGIGTWYVFRGEGIVVILLVGFIASWGLVDRVADGDAFVNPDADIRLLAIGDSFISGEGAAEFLPGTNVVGGDDQNECRRAPTAYPYLLGAEYGYGVVSVACSGARVRDLTRCGQMADRGERECRDDLDAWSSERGTLGDDIAGRLPQLANFTDDEFERFDAVIVSIGGNDVGFSDIVQACLLPDECSVLEPRLLAEVDELGDTAQQDDLVDLYGLLRGLVGDDTPIVVVPYPRLLDGDDPCGVGLSADEHVFVADFIDHLAAEIRSAAASAGVHVFEGVLDAFDGIQLCDDPAGANHLRLDPPRGDWTLRYLPNKLVHNSMHPNERGHAAIAAELGPFLEQVLAGEVPVADVVEPEPSAAAGDGDPFADVPANDEFITSGLFDTARSLVVPLALLLIAGVVFAAGLVRLRLGAWLRPQG